MKTCRVTCVIELEIDGRPMRSAVAKREAEPWLVEKGGVVTLAALQLATHIAAERATDELMASIATEFMAEGS